MQNCEYKPILKNLDKFGDIKLSPGIVIDNKKRTKREDPRTGISSRHFGNYWYYLGEDKVIFKSFECMENTKPNRIVNELLFYEISKQVEIDCAKCKLASIDGISGIASYNVLGKDEKLITGSKLKHKAGDYEYNNTLKSYYNALKILKSKGYKINIRKETLKLYQICLIDELLLHTDRHSENIQFIENTKTNEIRLSPIFDNEFAFCSFNLDNTVQDYREIDFNIAKSLFSTSRNLLLVNKIESGKEKYDTIKNDLVIFASKNQDAKKILIKTLDKIDIQTAIKNVENMGITISNDYKDLITMITCESVKEFRRTIETLKKILNNKEKYLIQKL